MTPRAYLLTYLALLGLSLLTFGLSFLPLAGWAVPTALTIAATKAWLVAMFFMHLKTHGASDRAAVIIGLLLALLLIGFAALDVATR